jgi:hypothetical protein
MHAGVRNTILVASFVAFIAAAVHAVAAVPALLDGAAIGLPLTAEDVILAVLEGWL